MHDIQARYHFSFSPHGIRHLFVTHCLVEIKREAAGDERMEGELRELLFEYMGWRDKKTLASYDQSFLHRDALATIGQFQVRLENPASVPALPTSTRTAIDVLPLTDGALDELQALDADDDEFWKKYPQ